MEESTPFTVVDRLHHHYWMVSAAHDHTGPPFGWSQTVGIPGLDEPKDVLRCAEAVGVALLLAQLAFALYRLAARLADDALHRAFFCQCVHVLLIS